MPTPEERDADQVFQYSMHPCRYCGLEAMERCGEDDPELAVWGVYRRGEDNLEMWVSDHGTKEEAEAELRRLSGLAPTNESAIALYEQKMEDLREFRAAEEVGEALKSAMVRGARQIGKTATTEARRKFREDSLDEIGVPEELVWKIWCGHVLVRLQKLGYSMDAAREEVALRSTEAKLVLKTLLDEPVELPAALCASRAWTINDLWTSEPPKEEGSYWFYGELNRGAMGQDYFPPEKRDPLKARLSFVEVHATSSSLIAVSEGRFVSLRKFDIRKRGEGHVGYWMKAVLPATPGDPEGVFAKLESE